MSADEQTDRQLGEVTETVRALVEIMRNNGLTTVKVSVGDVKITLEADGARGDTKSLGSIPETRYVAAEVEIPVEAGVLITAPMIGTYYTSSGPGEQAFVRLGERIEVGQTIGIIEAMKIMNEIPAERAGIVLEILALNAQAVEYGSPLLRIAPDETDG